MNKTLLLLLFMFFAVLIWSAVNHFDYFTWFLEAIPAILALAILALTFKRFRLINLTISKQGESKVIEVEIKGGLFSSTKKINLLYRGK